MFTTGLLRVLKFLPVFRRLARPVLGVGALLLLSTAVAWAFTLNMFTASYDGATARVEWEVSTEADITAFELYRKGPAESAFTLVNNVTPNGQRRYSYTDADLYRPSGGVASPDGSSTASRPSSGPFTYRLTVRVPGTDQSYTTTLMGTPSAVQRSWGTIKSMFR